MPFNSKRNIDSKNWSQVDELYECCNQFYQRNGDDAPAVSCPKANLLRYELATSPTTPATSTNFYSM